MHFRDASLYEVRDADRTISGGKGLGDFVMTWTLALFCIYPELGIEWIGRLCGHCGLLNVRLGTTLRRGRKAALYFRGFQNMRCSYAMSNAEKELKRA